MADEANEPNMQPMDPEEPEASDRRDFLRGLGKWSMAAIAAILLIESPSPNNASTWGNSRERLHEPWERRMAN